MSRNGCEREGSQQSSHSPSVVDDGEPIVYFAIDPTTASAKSIKEFSRSKLKDFDMSVCRSAYCSEGDALNSVFAPVKQKNPDAGFIGALWAFAKEIRAIPLGDTFSAFCVLDDGLDNYAAHAVMGFSLPTDSRLMNNRAAARLDLRYLFLRRGLKEELGHCPFSLEPVYQAGHG